VHRALLQQREDRVTNVASTATSTTSADAFALAAFLASSSVMGTVAVMVV
jgi:hypothetical protein